MAELAVPFIIGRKRGMTQRYTEDGIAVPVTVVSAGPCPVTRLVTSKQNPKYFAIQIGYEECRPKVLSKPRRGELGITKGKATENRNAGKKADTTNTGEGESEKIGKALRYLREARVEKMPEAKVGDAITVNAFTKNQFVDVIGTSKGRGFMGTIRAHHFNRGPASHGSMNIRQPGSVGSSADPSHTFRGTRMGKRLGGYRATSKNVRVFDIDAEKNLLYIHGAVAGPTGGLVMVRKATTPPPIPKAQPAVKKASQKGGPEKKK
jgi:large subunit ribosomal protein L3